MRLLKQQEQDYILIPGDEETAAQLRKTLHEMIKALGYLPDNGVDFTPLFGKLPNVANLLEALDPDSSC